MTGILFLIIATVCAAMFSIFFKIFQLKDIDSLQAIFFNYLTAFVLGLLISFDGELVDNPLKARWLFPVIVLGFIFVAGMVLLSFSTRRVGVAISTVCSRASMVIPIIISYQLIAGSDKPKWLPISLVLVGMILAIWTGKDKQFSFKDIFAPVIVFLTFGISNSMLKIIQDRVSVARADWPDYMVDKELALVSACIFLAAMLFCSVSFFRKDRAPFRWRNLLGGIGLGAANYGCTYILMLAMKTIDSSILFPFHNLGIVAIGAIVGWICFHEKMRPHQVIGIVLAAAAIFWLCI